MCLFTPGFSLIQVQKPCGSVTIFLSSVLPQHLNFAAMQTDSCANVLVRKVSASTLRVLISRLLMQVVWNFSFSGIVLRDEKCGLQKVLN